MLPSIKTLYKIGPGPSSSHTIGPFKAASDFLKATLKLNSNPVRFTVTLFGSLAFTGKGHCTDKIIKSVLHKYKVEVKFDIDTKKLCPNMMEFTAFDADDKVICTQDYNSVGGGDVLKGNEYLIPHDDIYPFSNFLEMRQYMESNDMTVRDLILKFEGEDILPFLKTVLNKMIEVVDIGLKTTGEVAGILHVKRMAKETFAEAMITEDKYIKIQLLLASYAYAANECNCAGEQVVTCPTCGATGVLTSLMNYAKRNLDMSDDTMLDGLAMAGLIGLIVRTNASISGAVAGCQAEIGTATSMAAGAMCIMDNLTMYHVEYAAEIAMEHSLGLTCDPVKGYVAIPCIERNVMGVLKAMDAYVLSKSLAKLRKNFISFDEAVEVMYESGLAMNEDYKETSKGGLAKVHIC